MNEKSAYVKAMVILQIILTVASVYYVVNIGFSKVHPAAAGEIIKVVVVYGILGLLCSPIAFLYLILGIIVPFLDKNYHLIQIIDKISVAGGDAPGYLSVLWYLFFAAVSLLFAVAFFRFCFMPFMVFLDNLDYAVYLIFQPYIYIADCIGRIVHRGVPRLAKFSKGEKDGMVYAGSGNPDVKDAYENNIGQIVVRSAGRIRNLKAFNSLIGVDRAIQEIKDALEIPLLYPEKVREYDIKPPKGLLLCGPSGTGKTSLARATAEYFGCYFSYVKGSELLKPYVGSSEASLKELFNTARANRPAIIFFDEIDAICRKRDGSNLNRASDILLNILLAEMDGFEKDYGLFIMGATNRVDVLDEAVLRPGRFDSVIELPLPDKDARRELFWLFLKDKPVAETIELAPLAEKSSGMSPAQIEGVCRKAALRALKRDVATGRKGITNEDIQAAIEEEKAFQRKA